MDGALLARGAGGGGALQWKCSNRLQGGRNAAPAPEDGCAVRPRVRETMRGSEGPQFFDGLLGLVVTIKRVLEGFDGLL